MLGKHLLGVYEKAFRAEDPWLTRFEKAKTSGFDYMEISIDEQDSRIDRLYWSKKQRLELFTQAFNSGMPLRSMCLSAHRRFPFGSTSPAAREKAHEIMKRAIEFSCDLGIRVIQLAGYDVYYEPSTPMSIDRFREAMEWSAEQAEKCQIMLAMEIMDTPFINSITKHLQYEENIRSPWYKVYPDIGNLSAWPENNPMLELASGISSIVAVHLKDTKPVTRDFPGQFKKVPFGDGCVDFSGLFSQLETLGYAGPYMMEMWHQPPENDVRQVLEGKKYIEMQYNMATRGSIGVSS